MANCKTSYCNVTCHYFIHHGEGGDSTYVLTTKNPINMSKNLFALKTNPTHVTCTVAIKYSNVHNA